MANQMKARYEAGMTPEDVVRRREKEEVDSRHQQEVEDGRERLARQAGDDFRRRELLKEIFAEIEPALERQKEKEFPDWGFKTLVTWDEKTFKYTWIKLDRSWLLPTRMRTIICERRQIAAVEVWEELYLLSDGRLALFGRLLRDTGKLALDRQDSMWAIESVSTHQVKSWLDNQSIDTLTFVLKSLQEL